MVAAAGFGLVLGAQGTAQAAASASFMQDAHVPASGGSWTDGGYGRFNADPLGSWPGDAIQACDTASDGWGVEIKLDIGGDGTIDRTATTDGHTAGYCSPWKTGNIAEGTLVVGYICAFQGIYTSCVTARGYA
jgi:hypothetical protein